MLRAYQNFLHRVSKIHFHGIGLSVDVYSPNLFELVEQFAHHGLSYGYLEIFKASQQALKEVRSRLPSALLEYHADGLWVTQPNWMNSYPFEEELEQAVVHLKTLGCSWLNQECASKQMVGYSFGTYLPPLFTKQSAHVTAENVKYVQGHLDTLAGESIHNSPLFLLETPPLTYFGFGDGLYQDFFQWVTQETTCGLVLDIGHIWTAFRYSGAWQRHSLENFLDEFLISFPINRVVQIHVAGLDVHPLVAQVQEMAPIGPPDWIDSHSAPIPQVLFDMLDYVLAHPHLVNLKGIALEVDTKPIEHIVEEFTRFRDRYEWWEHSQRSKGPTIDYCDTNLLGASLTFPSPPYNKNRWGGASEIIPGCRTRANVKDGGINRNSEAVSCESSQPYHNFQFDKIDQPLAQQYEHYVKAVTGQCQGSEVLEALGGQTGEFARNLDKYVHGYLPYEILVWGGDLREMFPKTMYALEENGVQLTDFIQFWYDQPRSVQEPYDFFLLKLSLFVKFVQAVLPVDGDVVIKEAAELRMSYSILTQGEV